MPDINATALIRRFILFVLVIFFFLSPFIFSLNTGSYQFPPVGICIFHPFHPLLSFYDTMFLQMHIFRKTINSVAGFYPLVKLSDLHLLEVSLHAFLDSLCYSGVGGRAPIIPVILRQTQKLSLVWLPFR